MGEGKREKGEGIGRERKEKGKKMEFAHDRRIPDEYQWSRTPCQSRRRVIRHAYEQRRASHVSGSIAFNWSSRIELARSNYLPALRSLHVPILDGTVIPSRWYPSLHPAETGKEISPMSRRVIRIPNLFSQSHLLFFTENRMSNLRYFCTFNSPYDAFCI